MHTKKQKHLNYSQEKKKKKRLPSIILSVLLFPLARKKIAFFIVGFLPSELREPIGSK